MNILNVVDKPILKLIYKHNIICLVVDNVYLLDNVHKLIYDWGICVQLTENCGSSPLTYSNVWVPNVTRDTRTLLKITK